MNRVFWLALVLVGSATAAPVPPDDSAPNPKLLVGVWRYSSEKSALPPWGTAVATLTADGKLHTTFNMPGGGTGHFRDSDGSYRLKGRTLHVVFAQGVGTPDERKDEAFLTVVSLDKDELRMRHPAGTGEKREILLYRDKESGKPVAPRP